MHGVTKSLFKAGYLYWIQMEDMCYVKIGVAIDVRARLKELQTGCPIDLKNPTHVSRCEYVLRRARRAPSL